MARVTSALAVLLLAVLPLTPATPVAPTSLILVSQGSDGAAAIADSGQAALSADGTATAFDSTAVLRTSAAVPQSPAQDTAHRKVYVRDRLAGRTTLLSDGGLGDATAPSLSATGRLVAFEANDARSGENEIDVATEESQGDLVRTRVTGNRGDPRYQRIGACPFADEAAGLGRCGPRLSADGSTLAYPATLSPVSPSLRLSVPGGDEEGARPVAANLIDFVPADQMAEFGGAVFGILQVTLTYTNTGDAPIDFTAVPAATAPFRITQATCGRRLAPGGSCDVDVEFDAGGTCPDNGTSVIESGELTTTATTPDGQTGVQLVATCAPFSSTSGTPEARPARYATPVAATPECAAPPTGLPLAAVPPQDDGEADNQGTSAVDNGQVEVGRPELVWTTVSGNGVLSFTAPDCSVRLVDPTTLRPATPLPTDQPPPCHQGEQLGEQLGEPSTFSVPAADSCTAYFLLDPRRVATSAGLLTLDDEDCFACRQHTYIAVTGTRHVIVARHGPAFATAPGTVVSVDGHGNPVPDASQPTLSTSGRYVGFTAPVPIGTPGQQPAGGTGVWRRDTSGKATILVSCLPGAGACRRDTTASFPSISGDGSRIAFLARPNGSTPAQVYVRETVAGQTVLVSGRGGAPGNASGSDPVISQDGSTVAFASTATNLPGSSTGGQALNAYLDDLGPGTTGLVRVGSLAGSKAAVRPALDAHGRLVAFESTSRLLPTAASGVDSAYLFGRFGELAFAPSSISFGKLVAGLPQQTRTVTVTDTGLGPITFTGVAITGPFRLIVDSCAGLVLHRGQRCVATVVCRPVGAGRPAGVLTWTTADDGEPPVRTGVRIGATIVLPTAPLLTVSPTVADSGQVVRATGAAFPAGVVTLRWSAGLGTTTAVVGADGRFAVDLVIFPDDLLGQRTLLAAGPSGTVLASAAFLAVPDPEQPPFHKQRP